MNQALEVDRKRVAGRSNCALLREAQYVSQISVDLDGPAECHSWCVPPINVNCCPWRMVPNLNTLSLYAALTVVYPLTGVSINAGLDWSILWTSNVNDPRIREHQHRHKRQSILLGNCLQRGHVECHTPCREHPGAILHRHRIPGPSGYGRRCPPSPIRACSRSRMPLPILTRVRVVGTRPQRRRCRGSQGRRRRPRRTAHPHRPTSAHRPAVIRPAEDRAVDRHTKVVGSRPPRRLELVRASVSA